MSALRRERILPSYIIELTEGARIEVTGKTRYDAQLILDDIAPGVAMNHLMKQGAEQALMTYARIMVGDIVEALGGEVVWGDTPDIIG